MMSENTESPEKPQFTVASRNSNEIHERDTKAQDDDRRKQVMELLEASKDKNFVFLFGPPGSGKTAVLGTILQSMHRGDVHGKFYVHGASEKSHYKRGADLWTRIRSSFADKRFPARSDVTKTIELHVEYKHPANPDPVHIVFLEMAGDNFDLVKLNERGEKLPIHIKQFLSIPNINIMFLIVAPWRTDRRGISLVVDFLAFVNEHAPNLVGSRVILLISQWDQYPLRSTKSVEQFALEEMTEVYQKINSNNNVIRSYSVGTVLHDDTGAGDIIMDFDHTASQQLFARIYETFTGIRFVPPNHRPWWRRIFS